MRKDGIKKKGRHTNQEEVLLMHVLSFLVLVFAFSLVYGLVLQVEDKRAKFEKEKETIEDCLRVLSQDCQQKCPTFIGEDVLFIAKECKGKELKSAWLSMPMAKGYYDGKALRWFDGFNW